MRNPSGGHNGTMTETGAGYPDLQPADERSGLEQLIGSSVTQRVLAISLCPVLVIPNTIRERAPQPVTAEEVPDVNLGLDVA